jgi:hypothetical protein
MAPPGLKLGSEIYNHLPLDFRGYVDASGRSPFTRWLVSEPRRQCVSDALSFSGWVTTCRAAFTNSDRMKRHPEAIDFDG